MSQRFLFPCAAVLMLAGAPCLAQTQDGKLIDFHMTAVAQMQGMSMPARSIERKVCMVPGKFDPQALLHEGSDCRISNYRENGATTTFHVACTRPQVVTSDGEFHRRADGGFDGTMHTAMTAAGRAITVQTTYQGTPGAACTVPQAK